MRSPCSVAFIAIDCLLRCIYPDPDPDPSLRQCDVSQDRQQLHSRKERSPCNLQTMSVLPKRTQLDFQNALLVTIIYYADTNGLIDVNSSGIMCESGYVSPNGSNRLPGYDPVHLLSCCVLHCQDMGSIQLAIVLAWLGEYI